MSDRKRRKDGPAQKPVKIEEELLTQPRDEGAPPGDELQRMPRRITKNFRMIRAKLNRHLNLMD